MVDEVRERVIRASAYRPFEGEHRVFVIDAAEAMRDESQNALLKTLEEPPSFVHLILLTSEPEGLLETIASRCQPVDFAPLPAEVLEAQLRDDARGGGRRAGGDRRRRAARRRRPGARPPAALADRPRAARRGRGAASPRPSPTSSPSAPWRRLLDRATAAGEEAEAAAREALEEESQAGLKRTAKDIADGAKRAGRRRRTEILDLGLELTALWLRDLAALAAGAEEVVFDRDRLDLLRAQAAKVDPALGPRRRRRRPGHPPRPRPERLRGAGPRSALLRRGWGDVGPATLTGRAFQAVTAVRVTSRRTMATLAGCDRHETPRT